MDRNELIAMACAPVEPHTLRAVLDGKRAPSAKMRDFLRDFSPEKIAATLQARGIQALTIDDEEYPAGLHSLVDAPPVLFIKGKGNFPSRICAMIGARQCSAYGKKIAEQIAGELAGAGVCILSGLARGIDGIAHQAALDAGGNTIAVLGSGADIIYPAEHAQLAQDIEQHGLLLTEYPPGSPPLAHHFPGRNRIIAALADAVLLIEGRHQSGARHTIDHALDLGKDIFALPGNIDAPGSELPNQLISEGMHPLLGSRDVLEAMHWGLRIPEEAPQTALSLEEEMVLTALREKPLHGDEIAEYMDMEAAKLNSLLTMMQIKGIIKRFEGKFTSS